MMQRTGGQDRRVGGMSGRAAAWLAWSLVVVSVVLLVGGISFALMIRSASAHSSRARASRSDLDHLRVRRASFETSADCSLRSQVSTDALLLSRIAEARLTSASW